MNHIYLNLTRLSISKWRIFFAHSNNGHEFASHPNRQIIEWELFLGSFNIPLGTLTRSIKLFFSFSTLTYDHPHYANDQINIRTLLNIHRTWMLSKSDALEYVHATVFFTFLKIYSRSPHRWKAIHYITFLSFYYLSFATQ